MTTSNWDLRWMALAQFVATWSKDRGRKVGAVIVGPDNEIRSTGYNGIPRGVNDDVEERHEAATGEKYLWVSHAERNAIYMPPCWESRPRTAPSTFHGTPV